MIDIHSHIIWGVDDGPETRDDSLSLLAAAREAGTTEMVATPHASPEFPYQRDIIRERFADLQQAVPEMPLHLGCDFHLSYDNLKEADEEPTRYSIDHGPYILVEFSDLAIFKSADADLERLRDSGVTPIVTHPERNPLLRQRLPQLTRWVEAGCLMQITASSYLGRFGKRAERFAHQMTEAGLVHVIASDAHSVKHRSPDMRDSFAHIQSLYGPETAEIVFRRNPGAVLHGGDITPVQPKRSFLGGLKRLFR